MKIESSIERLFDAFGKRASPGQEDIYCEWGIKAGRHANDIIESSIQNDSTFPPIARLNQALINKKTSSSMISDSSIDRCYYCCDAGVIPYLYEPEGKSAYKYYIRMFACECSQALPSLRSYFEEWGELQFEDIKKNYDKSYSYPHIVESIKLEKNKELNEKQR